MRARGGSVPGKATSNHERDRLSTRPPRILTRVGGRRLRTRGGSVQAKPLPMTQRERLSTGDPHKKKGGWVRATLPIV